MHFSRDQWMSRGSRLFLPNLQRCMRAKVPREQQFCDLRDDRLIWGAVRLSIRTGAKYVSHVRSSSCLHCSRVVVAGSYRVISCELGSQGATWSLTTVALTCSWRGCGARLSQLRNPRTSSLLSRASATNLRHECVKPRR